jgi:tripartite-type tricarboxylate transporter receptor subunit TctC
MSRAAKSWMQPACRFARLALAAAAFALAPCIAHGQAYPLKPIRWIVPFPPGGSTDILARVVGQKLTEAWGQQVVIENKGGAGGTIGATEVARARANGYTLLMGAIHHTIASSVYPSLPYDFLRDFAPVTVVAIVPNVLVVNPSVPAKSVPELITYAKANPGKLTYGSAGVGTAHHLIGAKFNLEAGVDIVQVRPARAGEDAEGNRGQAPWRGRQDLEHAGREETAARGRRRTGRQYPGRNGRADQERNRIVRQDREAGEDHSRIGSM